MYHIMVVLVLNIVHTDDTCYTVYTVHGTCRAQTEYEFIRAFTYAPWKMMPHELPHYFLSYEIDKTIANLRPT